jgi:hypothetical protein
MANRQRTVTTAIRRMVGVGYPLHPCETGRWDASTAIIHAALPSREVMGIPAVV